MSLFGMSRLDEVLRIASVYLNSVTDTDIANHARTHMFGKDRSMVVANRNPAGRSVLGIHPCRDISVSHFQLNYPILVRRNRSLTLCGRRFVLHRPWAGAVGTRLFPPRTRGALRRHRQCLD